MILNCVQINLSKKYVPSQALLVRVSRSHKSDVGDENEMTPRHVADEAGRTAESFPALKVWLNLEG
jgi:hypothetical protein